MLTSCVVLQLSGPVVHREHQLAAGQGARLSYDTREQHMADTVHYWQPPGSWAMQLRPQLKFAGHQSMCPCAKWGYFSACLCAACRQCCKQWRSWPGPFRPHTRLQSTWMPPQQPCSSFRWVAADEHLSGQGCKRARSPSCDAVGSVSSMHAQGARKYSEAAADRPSAAACV